MAIKYFCDRCGKRVEGNFGVKAVKFKRHHEVCGQEWDDYQNYDLCSNCLNSLEGYLNMDDKKNG